MCSAKHTSTNTSVDSRRPQSSQVSWDTSKEKPTGLTEGRRLLFTKPTPESLIYSAFRTSQNHQAAIKRRKSLVWGTKANTLLASYRPLVQQSQAAASPSVGMKSLTLVTGASFQVPLDLGFYRPRFDPVMTLGKYLAVFSLAWSPHL